MTDSDDQIFVLSNKASEYFLETFFHQLKRSIPGVRELKINRKIFPGFPVGEKYIHIDVGDKPLALFGRDCIVVSSLLTDDDFLEFFRVAYTLANLGSRSRIFIIPFLASRESSSGYISQIKPNAQLFSALTTYGLGNSFLFMDLHIPGFLHYLERSSLHVELCGYKSMNEEMKRNKSLVNFFDGEYMFVAPDLGRPKVVADFAKDHGKELAFIHRHEKTNCTSHASTNTGGMVIGDVRNKHTIIYDDLIRTGSTLTHGAELLLEKGALSVKAIVSHLCGDEEAVQNLLQSRIQHIVISNSTIFSQSALIAAHPERFTVVDVSPLFAEAVHNILQPNMLSLPLSPPMAFLPPLKSSLSPSLLSGGLSPPPSSSSSSSSTSSTPISPSSSSPPTSPSSSSPPTSPSSSSPVASPVTSPLTSPCLSSSSITATTSSSLSSLSPSSSSSSSCFSSLSSSSSIPLFPSLSSSSPSSSSSSCPYFPPYPTSSTSSSLFFATAADSAAAAASLPHTMPAHVPVPVPVPVRGRVPSGPSFGSVSPACSSRTLTTCSSLSMSNE